MTKEAIGKRIRDSREQSGLTVSQLSEILGVRYQSIQQWESGKTSPRQNRIKQLAHALGIKASWLQFGTTDDEIIGPDNFKKVTQSEEFKQLFKMAHSKTMEQFLEMGWLVMDRRDVTIEITGDLLYRALINEIEISNNDS